MSVVNSSPSEAERAALDAQCRTQELYRAFIEQAGEGFWWVDADGYCLDVNAAGCQILGYAREELLGHCVRDLFHPDDQTARADDLHRVHAGETIRATRRLRKKDGTYALIEGTAQPAGDRTVVFFHDVTQQLAAEEALRNREEEFRALFELAAIGYAQAEPSTGRLTRVNRRLCELTGYSADELLTLTFEQLTHPEDRSINLQGLAEKQCGKPADCQREQRFIRKDGSILWVQVSWSLLRDTARRPSRFLAIIQDVTATREAHQALVESERALREAERLAGVGSWTVELATGTVWCSEQLYRMFQADPASQQPSLAAIRELIHPDDWPKAEEAIARTVATRQPFRNLELRAVRPDGSTRWFLTQGELKVGPENRPYQLVGCCLDITQQREAELARYESETRYRILTNVVPQLVWTMAPSGEFIEVNDRWREYYGFALGELEQIDWSAVVHSEDLPKVREAWTVSMSTGTNLEVECRLRRADGQFRWHLARGVPIRDAEGQVVLWCGTCTDIHERRLAEAALRDEHRRKDEFLAMLAHELRNPLAPIANATEILKLRAGDQSVVEKQSQTIERNTRHLARLVDDLLEVARINEGKIELRKCRVNLANVVHQAAGSVQTHLSARKHQLSISLPPEPIELEADPVRLVQIVVNLLTNSVKYSEPGGEISITGSVEGRNAYLRIRDTGQGIAPELLPRIFDLFTQGEQTLARTEGGLGIGLTLVRRLTELHGGTVTAHSEGPGKGSEFEICLPLATPAPEAAASSPARPPGSGTERRVLIVEDNQDAADSLQELLTLWNFEVRVARDGRQALELADAFDPEVILLDLGLPGMDGLEVARRLRVSTARSALLLALTGYGDDAHRQQTQRAGFDGHLVKPLDPDLLRAYLQNQKSPEPGPAIPP